MTSQPLLFDRIRQRCLRLNAQKNFQEDVYFFHPEIESILIDRLSFFKQSFSRVFVSGVTSNVLQQGLWEQGNGHKLFIAANALNQFRHKTSDNSIQHLTIDEEKLPFLHKSFDLVVSFLELQNLNCIVDILHQNYHLVRSPGLYLSAFVGGDSFYELRTSLLQAELELTQGATARVHPMIDFETALKIFTRIGFKQPLVDRQVFTIEYGSLKLLLNDLKCFSARNSLNVRSRMLLHRKILNRAEEIYKDLCSNAEGNLNVTIEIIFLTGWV